MDAFRIKGPCNLNGKIGVPGAKNAALPLMAAALLTEDEVVLHDCGPGGPGAQSWAHGFQIGGDGPLTYWPPKVG